jgi:rubrerythrin
VLENAGFSDVFSLDGGIIAWNGLVAGGSPEPGMAVFPPGASTDDIISILWAMEEGARRFYGGVREFMEDPEAKKLFQHLVTAEEHHRESLENLYDRIPSTMRGRTLPFHSDKELDDIMEGGIRLSDSLKWAKGRDQREIIEYSMALETSSFDLYLNLERTVKDENTGKVLGALSEEEQKHLKRLTALFETLL